jgi:hypothetical protein
MDATSGTAFPSSLGHEAPRAASPGTVWLARVRKSRWIFAAGLGLFLLLLLLHNRYLFTLPIHEDGDYAANSLLIEKAKQLRLLVGNYSRMGFNHPGPGILYVLAFSEWAFHDQLHLVPAPHNAQMLGAVLFDAFLAALSLAVLHAHFRSLLAALTAAAVYIAYFGLNGQWSFDWMPYLYYTPFALMLVSCASVASGRAGHLPFLALGGGLLVHGHICFVAFVVPLTLYALVFLGHAHGFSARRVLLGNAISFLAFVAVVGLFVLPIALHTYWHYPGEMAKYLDYVHQSHHYPRLKRVLSFLMLAFTSKSVHSVLLTLAILAVAAVTLPRRGDGRRRRYTQQAFGVAAVTTVLLLYYAWRGVDDLSQTYTVIFYGSVALLLLTTAAMNAALLFGTDSRRRRVLAALVTLAALWAAVTGHFVNEYRGCRLVTDLAATELSTTPAETPILVTHEHDCWPCVVGFVLEMERHGRHVFVAESELAFLYTPNYARGWESLHDAKHLDFARPTEPREHVRRVVYEDAELSVRELDPRYVPGTVLALTGGSHAWGIYKRCGWSWHEKDGTYTEGPEASLSLEMDRPITGNGVLSLTARPCLPPRRDLLNVDVEVNGEMVAHWQLAAADDPLDLRTTIPATVLQREGPVQICFHFPGAQPGGEVRSVPGRCSCGLCVQSLCLAAENTTAP